MGRWRSIARRLLLPGPWWTALLAVLAAAGLLVTFSSGREDTPFGYGCYALAFYALAVLVLAAPRAVGHVRSRLEGNPYGGRFLNDLSFRAGVTLAGSLLVNLFFAGYKLVAGFFYASAWFVAVGVYHLVLSLARFLLLRDLRGAAQDRERQLRKSRFCGGLLFALNLALTGMMAQMIFGGRGRAYPGHLIYAFAAYAFYCLINSIVNLIRYRRLGSPLLSAAKAINLATALVAVFTLQTALLAAFGEDPRLHRVMNALTGGCVCLLIFAMAVLMVVRANRQLRLLRGAAPGSAT